MVRVKHALSMRVKKIDKKTWIFIAALAGLSLYAAFYFFFPDMTFAKDLKSSINKSSTSVTGLIKAIFPGIAAVSFAIIGLAFFGPRVIKEWAKAHILSTIAGIGFVLLAAAAVSFFTSTFGG